MQLMPRQVVAGVVIRERAVELLVMHGQRVQSRVRVSREGPEASQLVAALQQAVAAAKLKTKRMAVSIASEEILFRFFSIPMTPKPEWHAVIQFEARKYIPL